jgi:hypothetical protein
MPRGGPHEETRQALQPPGRRYEEQIYEVAVVEVAGSDAEEADDLSVLDGNQAGSFPDERPDLLAPVGPWGSMTTMAPTSAACAARNSAMVSLHDG